MTVVSGWRFDRSQMPSQPWRLHQGDVSTEVKCPVNHDGCIRVTFRQKSNAQSTMTVVSGWRFDRSQMPSQKSKSHKLWKTSADSFTFHRHWRHRKRQTIFPQLSKVRRYCRNPVQTYKSRVYCSSTMPVQDLRRRTKIISAFLMHRIPKRYTHNICFH